MRQKSRPSCHDRGVSPTHEHPEADPAGLDVDPANSAAPSSRTSGSQTLTRGIEALKFVAASNGVTVAEVGEFLKVHRTVAYRLLNALADAALVYRGADGKIRGSFGLSELAVAAYSSVRSAATKHLQEASNDLGAAIALIILEESTARAVLVVSPRSGSYHVAFSEGSTHPLDRGAAGHAISSLLPHDSSAHPEVLAAASRGYTKTYGEVEPLMYGFAVPLQLPHGGPAACLNVIATRSDIEDDAVARLQRAAQDILAELG